MKFDRHIGSNAVEVPVKFQSDRTILNTNLAASRLYEILRKDVFSDIETGPRCLLIEQRLRKRYAANHNAHCLFPENKPDNLVLLVAINASVFVLLLILVVVAIKLYNKKQKNKIRVLERQVSGKFVFLLQSYSNIICTSKINSVFLIKYWKVNSLTLPVT